jgi:hypothetical protein
VNGPDGSRAEAGISGCEEILCRLELDLLRRTRLSVRFGKLNHCTMDDANPVGARCLEDAVVPKATKSLLLIISE